MVDHPVFPFAAALLVVAGAPGAMGQPDFAALDLAQRTFCGEEDGDGFGNRAIVPGDINADGINDILIGARFNDAGGINAGRAYAVSGADGSLLHIFTGEAAGDELGHRLEYVGDLDLDGYDDLYTSAYPHDSAGENAGRVYIFSGRTGNAIHIIDGEAAGDEFGRAIESIPDVNNDGVRDLLIGAWLYDGPAVDSGRAYLISGRTGETIHHWTGEEEGDYFGFEIIGIDDIDNDGVPDIAIGAPKADGAVNDTGRVYFVSSVTGDVISTFTGSTFREEMARVRRLPDMNMDGVDEVLIAPWQFSAYQQRVVIVSPVTGEVIHEFNAFQVDDDFGERFKWAGDMNADGFPDIAISAPRFHATGYESGQVYVFSGRDFSLMHTWSGEAENDRFGRSMVTPGDLNGDGYDDLCISTPYHDANGAESGRMYAFSGKTGALMFTLTGENSGDYFGHHITVLGDLDTDGRADFMVSAVYAGENDPGPGCEYLFFSDSFTLGSEALRAGQRGTINAGGLDPAERAYLIASLGGIGAGPIINQLGGLQLDLLDPLRLIGPATANSSGQARWTIDIPDWLAERTVYFQAVAKRGAGGAQSVKSNPVTEYVNRR